MDDVCALRHVSGTLVIGSGIVLSDEDERGMTPAARREAGMPVADETSEMAGHTHRQ